MRFFRSAKDYLEGRSEPSGQKLLGLSIWDFTKTGISTSFPTGAVVGIGSNVYGTELWPAYVPSFVWGQPGRLVEHRNPRLGGLIQIQNSPQCTLPRVLVLLAGHGKLH